MANQTFKWIKRNTGRWVLRGENGEIAAAVVPSGFDHKASPKFKAHVVGIARNHSSIAKYGKPHWTTGRTVKSAKLAVEAYIALHSWETVNVAA